LKNDPARTAALVATDGRGWISDHRKKSAQLANAELMRIGALGWIDGPLDRPTPSRRSPSKVQMLLKVIVFLTAAVVVDNLWLDGGYRHAMWQEANYQGQQFRYEVDSIVRKVVGR
jgi:hypothetical protein